MSSYILTSPIDILSPVTAAQINLVSVGSSFASQFQAPAVLTANIDFTLPSTAGTTGQYLQRTGATSLGWANITTTTTLGLPLSLRSYQNSTAVCTTANVTLRSVLTFYFPGSTALGGSPSSAYIVFSPSTNTTTCQAQIQDLTNATIVATATSGTFAAGTLNLLNLGTLSNISTGTSTWRLLASRPAGGTATIYCFKILF